MNNKQITGHIAAFITIIIWGTTFISTKILLVDFQPVEILFFRFVLGLFALIIVYPKKLKGTTIKQEITFAVAGLCGICLYYLLENIALDITLASNVGVIISVAPFFTAIMSHIFMKTKEQLKINFFVGFVVAMAGICLISFNGNKFSLNPLGDILAIASALVWAIYSLLTRKISSYGYNTVQTTRRVFAYGIAFMIPTLFFFDFNIDLSRMTNAGNLCNLIFLGLGASALCFVTWNYAVKLLGAIKTSVYIYIVPVITVMASAIVLQEQITLLVGIGTALTLTGLLVSEAKIKSKKRGQLNEYRK